jgi:hypothetical protein
MLASTQQLAARPCAARAVRSYKQCTVVAMAPNPRWKATMKHRRTRPIKVWRLWGVSVCARGLAAADALAAAEAIWER